MRMQQVVGDLAGGGGGRVVWRILDATVGLGGGDGTAVRMTMSTCMSPHLLDLKSLIRSLSINLRFFQCYVVFNHY